MIFQVEQHTIGVAFLGTPHHGSNKAAWGKYAASVVNIVRKSNKDVVNVLRPDSEMLRIIQLEFHYLLRSRHNESRSLNLTCFYEELDVKGIGFVSLNAPLTKLTKGYAETSGALMIIDRPAAFGRDPRL